MSDIFKLFQNTHEQQGDQNQQSVFNSEMDDLELPEGADIPDNQKLLSLTTALDKKVSMKVDDDKTPVAKNPKIPEDTDSDGESDGIEEREIGEEMLSVTSDLQAHGSQINEISVKLRDHESRLANVVDLDSSVRKLQTEISEVQKDLKSIKEMVKSLNQSLTTYQTATARKIADVERKAATRQLKLDPEVDETLIPPPTEVIMERDAGFVVVPTAESSTSKGKEVSRPVVVDLSEF